MNITQEQAQELLGALKEMVDLSTRHEITGTAFIIASNRAWERSIAAIAVAEAQKSRESHKSVTL